MEQRTERAGQRLEQAFWAARAERLRRQADSWSALFGLDHRAARLLAQAAAAERKAMQ